MPDAPAVAYASAPAVFMGTVTRIEAGSALSRMLEPVRQWLGFAPAPSAFGQQALVQVSAAWKGVRQSPVSVATDGGAMCGYPFVAGQQYLIYAHENGGQLSASLCSRTAEVSQAGVDLAFLQTQTPLAVAQGPVGTVAVWVGLGVMGVVLAGAAATVWMVARRRRAA